MPLGATHLVGMVAVAVRIEPVVALVIVLVHDGVGILGVDFRHVGVELPARIGRSGRGNNGNLGMLGLDGLVHDVEALPEFRTPVLVADAQVFQVERGRMSHLRPPGTPFRVDAAVAELDEVQGVLDENAVEAVAVRLRLERSDVLMAGELAGHAVVEHRQRGGAQAFRHQQVLIEADVLRGPVGPVVAEAHPFLARADGILPEHLPEIVGSLGSAAARETHESGMQVFQRL